MRTFSTNSVPLCQRTKLTLSPYKPSTIKNSSPEFSPIKANVTSEFLYTFPSKPITSLISFCICHLHSNYHLLSQLNM